jgi:hypothetical protein
MYWWGFNKTHGWVVLDRTISCNQPGQGGDLLFFRCSDSQTFSCQRGAWHEPAFIYAPKYLIGLPENEKLHFHALTVEIEKQLQAMNDDRMNALLEQKRLRTINNHKNFLESIGKPYRGIAEIDLDKRHRQTHCYLCKNSLDNSVNSECSACRWIICECGACGCGYTKY